MAKHQPGTKQQQGSQFILNTGSLPWFSFLPSYQTSSKQRKYATMSTSTDGSSSKNKRGSDDNPAAEEEAKRQMMMDDETSEDNDNDSGSNGAAAAAEPMVRTARYIRRSSGSNRSAFRLRGVFLSNSCALSLSYSFACF